MMLRARLLTVGQAHAAGFVAACIETLAGHSPLSMWAAHRLRRPGLADGDDLVERVHGGGDFAGAVTAFAAGERPSWTGS